MSDPNRKDFNPGATIQLSLDEVQLAELEARLEQPADSAERTAPPPLPAPASLGPKLPYPVTQDAPRHSLGKKIAYGAMVVALLVVAIAAGILVGGNTGQGPRAATPAGESAHPVAAKPPLSASSTVLTMPTIEMR